MFRLLQKHPVLRILLVYVVFATVWRVAFDSLLGGATLAEHRFELHRLEGYAFAVVSAGVLFLLVQLEWRRRREAEAAMRSSEELFHTLARLSPVGIFRSAGDGRCLYVNEAWTQITGMSVEQAIGEGWAAGVHPADRDRVLRAWQKALGTNASVRLEYRFLRRDGSIAWVLGEVHPESPAARSGFVGTITNITDRKTTEIALQSSEEKFRALIEHIPAVTFTRRLDPAMSSVFVSPQIEGVLGFTPDEWLANPALWSKQVHREDLPRVLDELGKPASNHVRSEYRIRHKNGSWVKVVDEATFLRGESGAPELVQGLMLDVTKTRQLEVDLERTQGRYEALMNSLEGVVWELEAESLAYTFVSTQAERLTGYHVDRWTREPRFWLNHVAAGDRERLEQVYRTVAATGEPAQVEYGVQAAGGREIWVRDSIARAVEPGAKARLRGLTVDVSESRRAAQRIEAMNAELERRVKDRTAELEGANEELRSFSYTVSHDLRAPLRAITGFGETLAREYSGPLGETGRGYLERVLSSAQRMGHLIEDLINLSRVTRAELNREPLDLSELATTVAAELQRNEPQRVVQFRAAPGLCVSADPRLLRVMLENLLGNAWKFTSKRGEAHVDLGVLRRPNGHRTFFIRDDGAGFDMEYAGKLFTPFQRLHSTSEFPGTGIGLATVHRIVTRHGGKIWAEGREGAGATFYFEI